ncbi:general alpha-glucoside permease [Plectosphaerella plurivora]|uniref:General alpha-glucoside permease n=1 Tax=Plectosphaerella plurivora TaxID=936078 RepID=A0A9P8VKA9_9PEZI|nr:general alpha-glucoside permease [Plectosphaerella plurivora]
MEKNMEAAEQVEAVAIADAAEKTTLTNHVLNSAAMDGAAEEHELDVPAALRAYPKAVGWALASAACVIMEGYDTNLLSNFFAYPSFLIKYGEFVGVSPEAPTGYHKYGSRRVQMGALFALTLAIFPVFFAPSLPVLVVGEILCGVPWGILATTSPAYSSEVLPTSLRTYMTSFTNMSFILGQLISAGILKGLSTRVDEWGYKIPFALQWAWPCVLIPLIYLSPESPWYLVRMGRIEEAEASLRRLQSPSANVDPRKTLSMIIYTNNLEMQLQTGTSYWDCFKGTELRRTEIACVCFAGQILCGISFAYNSSYFFSQMGLGTSTTYSLALGGTGLAFIGCLCNWFILMPRFGRRTIYVAGMFGMFTVLLLIGILSTWTSRPSVAMAQAVLTMAWTFIFQLSAGQLGWALPAEIGSTRLRQKTICLARDSSNIVGTIAGISQQYFMNPGALNLKGRTSYIWASTCLLTAVWSFFRLPETWKRSYHELDVLFAKKVSARKFASTHIDAFDVNDIAHMTGHAEEKTTIAESVAEKN